MARQAIDEMTTCAAFLDTMIYLEYKPFEEIDWHDALGIDRGIPIEIVLAGVTLQEIDNHKNKTPRLRDRARRVSSQLVAALSNGGSELRAQTRIVGALRPPAVDYDRLGLDRMHPDDRLVAAVFAYQAAHAGRRVVLVTEDGYPRLQAQTLGIETRTLSDDLKLPAVDDPLEKENRELKRRVQLLTAQQPRLSLALKTGGGTLRCVISDVPLLTQNEIDAAMQRIAEQIPPVEALRPSVEFGDGSPENPVNIDKLAAASRDLAGETARLSDEFYQRLFVPEQEYVRYEEERAAYLDDYREYLQRNRQIARGRARRIVLMLRLQNDGTIPAVDVDVRLHVPDGVEPSDSDEYADDPEMPAPPTPPRRRSAMGLLGASMDYYSRPLHRPLLPDLSRVGRIVPDNVAPLRIKKSNSFDVSTKVQRIKHGSGVDIPTVYLHIPEGSPVRPIQIDYALHAGNVPEIIRGKLNIVLTERPDSSERGPDDESPAR